MVSVGVTLSLILVTSAQELGDHTYSTEAIERGSRIYSRECALCHGPQGDIVDGVNLRTGYLETCAQMRTYAGWLFGPRGKAKCLRLD
ncbi:MAG: hypothetical protein CM1200mP40_03490 [Gammaproteobacteria bacterium]|nr:MAG: hypothetical protein CM1200mP40_03490 [Gammaproteobacteria bacterium]